MDYKKLGELSGKARKERSIEAYNRNPNVCLSCGKVIQIGEGQNACDARKKKFCNRSCSAAYNNKMFPKRQRKQRVCKVCGKEIRSKKNCYCRACNPNTQEVDWSSVTLGELRARHPYQRNGRIRELAREVYKKSGNPRKCAVCGYSLHFHVCHKKPINSFTLETTVSEINRLDNLVALCPNHHWELDNGKLQLSACSSTG